MTGGQGSGVLWRGMRQELLWAKGAAASFRQWKGEVIAELRTQEELARDALTKPWDPRWMVLLVQRISWDLL